MSARATQVIRRKMKTVPVALLVALIVVVEVPFGHSFPSAVPSFLWSPHHYGYGFTFLLVIAASRFLLILLQLIQSPGIQSKLLV
ncbi:hypothetical protein MTR67_002354 [Solanum verrucosum]|uniref:Uncharacterized protein n=1 Tax=Solanum verrucosum TaxID=315347 RepID=A0AAF0PPY4_SOLVR|nr:hypothetical protein MTR67_002354 [Solanum verrucosum]